jgi:hypothetical protein
VLLAALLRPRPAAAAARAAGGPRPAGWDAIVSRRLAATPGCWHDCSAFYMLADDQHGNVSSGSCNITHKEQMLPGVLVGYRASCSDYLQRRRRR